MDEGEERELFLFEFSRWVDQHAFDHGAVVGLPAIGLALREIFIGKGFVEVGNGARCAEFVGGIGDIDFFRLIKGGKNKSDLGGVSSGGNLAVSAGPRAELGERCV